MEAQKTQTEKGKFWEKQTMLDVLPYQTLDFYTRFFSFFKLWKLGL